MGYWSSLYSRFDVLIRKFPTLDPNKISYLSVILSLPFVYLYPSIYALLFLFLIVFLDYLDGVMARRLKKADDHIDLACDRVSELLISYKIGTIFMLAAVSNVWLSIYKLKNKNMPVVLPLRHFLIIYILYNHFFT